MAEILELGRISENQANLIGGKAYNLNKMIEAGFPVPHGFVVTWKGYEHFLDNCFLKDSIQKTTYTEDSRELKSLYKSISNAVQRQTISPNLAAPITKHYLNLEAKSVAVRSSATSEDSKQHSFAGQFETYLNITDEHQLLSSIVKCWSSLWSERALSYRLHNKDSLDSGKIAVVVQKMVQAQISGVIFTKNPVTKDENQFLIEASWGLGEAIVSGKTMTDAFVVDINSRKIIDKTINYKLHMCVPRDNQGTDDIKVPEDKRSLQTLSDDQVLELANIALNIRNFYQSEQDIEWAYDGKQFYILQSRPITTIDQNEVVLHDKEKQLRDRAIFTAVDIGESFTGIFTPLGLSFAKRYFYHTHSALISALGLIDTGNPHKYTTFLFGRTYMDMTYHTYLYAQSFLFRDQSKLLEKFSNEEINLKNYKNPYGIGPKGLNYLRSSLFYSKIVIKDLLTYKKRSRKFLKNRLTIFNRYRSLELKKLTLYDLHEKLNEAYQYFHDSCAEYAPPFMYGFVFYDVLKLLSKNWFPETAESIPELIKADASELRSSEVVSFIEDLAQEALRLPPNIQEIILTLPASQVAVELEAFPESKNFLIKYQNLLCIHGVRAHHEMELTNPRWIDDPSYILTTVKTYMNNKDFSIISTRETRNNERINQARKAIETMPWVKRKIYNFVINSYLKLSKIREEMRMCFIQGIWMNRLLVFEVVSRLVKEKVLNNEKECAFITYDDILLYTSGKASAWELFSREKIENNRRNHFINLHIPTPPLTYIGHWEPTNDLTEKSHTDFLKGLASSTGKIVGKARIILNLEEQMEEFQPGEILVTRFTDVAWTPLFNLASGVVADIGSMLSHSSIVARELGIPAVVNTKIATQTIRTGDTIVVDGNEGKVYISRTNSHNL